MVKVQSASCVKVSHACLMCFCHATLAHELSCFSIYLAPVRFVDSNLNFIGPPHVAKESKFVGEYMLPCRS